MDALCDYIYAKLHIEDEPKFGTEVEPYIGKIYEGEDNFVIKNEVGDTNLMYVFYMLDLIHINFGERRTNETIVCTKLPELVYEGKDDYKDIVKIYKRLINLGIVVGSCTFVRRRNKVLMQMPRGITVYSDVKKEDKAKKDYFSHDYFQHCIPKSMNYWRVMYMLRSEC